MKHTHQHTSAWLYSVIFSNYKFWFVAQAMSMIERESCSPRTFTERHLKRVMMDFSVVAYDCSSSSSPSCLLHFPSLYINLITSGALAENSALVASKEKLLRCSDYGNSANLDKVMLAFGHPTRVICAPTLLLSFAIIHHFFLRSTHEHPCNVASATLYFGLHRNLNF